jgi:hypothetical protein
MAPLGGLNAANTQRSRSLAVCWLYAGHGELISAGALPNPTEVVVARRERCASLVALFTSILLQRFIFRPPAGGAGSKQEVPLACCLPA